MSVYLTLSKLTCFYRRKGKNCFPKRRGEREAREKPRVLQSHLDRGSFPFIFSLGFREREKDEIPRRNKSQDKESMLS